jgi:hypothetical protein
MQSEKLIQSLLEQTTTNYKSSRKTKILRFENFNVERK